MNSTLPNSTSPLSPSCQRDATVAWQTAYFALLSLALNSMAQPSGRVLGLDAKGRTYLRASPIVNLLDACMILTQMLSFLVLDKRGWRGSAQEVLRRRFARDSSDADGEEGEGIEAIEKAWRLRVLLFVLGAALDAIKIFAMRGIPWTQTWAAMYLVSFLVIELMCALARYETGDGTELHTTPERKNRVRWFLVAGTQMMVLIWAASKIVSPFAQVPDNMAKAAGYGMAILWIASAFVDVYLLSPGHDRNADFEYAILYMAVPRCIPLFIIYQNLPLNPLHIAIENPWLMCLYYAACFLVF